MTVDVFDFILFVTILIQMNVVMQLVWPRRLDDIDPCAVIASAAAKRFRGDGKVA